MNPERRGLVTLAAIVIPFCSLQALLTLWMLTPGITPNLSEAERLIERQDFHRAVDHLKPLAATGSPRAQCLLGELYVKGEGVRKNIGEGIRYLESSAETGTIRAQYLLSRIYSYGEGVPRDLVRAHLWLSLAALQERKDAPGLLSMLEQMMTPDQIEKAWAMAEERVPGARAKIGTQ